jgi:phenylalanyl-tRNA synthetase beta chain
LVIAGEPPLRRATIPLRLDRVKTLAGAEVDPAEQLTMLQALGFHITEGGPEVLVEVPSWRPDVQGEADLVEEIVRVHGLDQVPHVALPRLEVVTSRRIGRAQRRRFLAARALASRGVNEAVTWSFLPKSQAELFGGGARELELANPISTELSDMRPSLLPNLIAAAGRNMARGFADIALFEAGQVYLGDAPEDEHLHVSGVRRGMTGPRHWAGERRAFDVFDVKADALAVLAAAGQSLDRLQTAAEGPAWYHPGRVGSLMLGPRNRLASFGEIHPRVLARMDVTGPVLAFEVDLDAIPLPKSHRIARPALDASDLQAITRDFAFVVASDVAADRIVRAAKSADTALVTSVSVFDVFSGEAIGQGRKSVAVEVTLQPRQQTLTEEDIEQVSGAIIAAVGKATGGELRT